MTPYPSSFYFIIKRNKPFIKNEFDDDYTQLDSIVKEGNIHMTKPTINYHRITSYIMALNQPAPLKSLFDVGVISVATGRKTKLSRLMLRAKKSKNKNAMRTALRKELNASSFLSSYIINDVGGEL